MSSILAGHLLPDELPVGVKWSEYHLGDRDLNQKILRNALKMASIFWERFGVLTLYFH